MKLLITGGTGLLGKSILKFAPPKWNTTITYLKNKPQNNLKSVMLNLSDLENIKRIIQKAKPELIIHTAAAKDIEWCEANKKEALQINALSTEIIAKESAKIGAKVVYISTDFVFDGNKGDYSEKDEPNPINFYGQTKLIGEEAVLKHPKNIVIRTNFYGIDPIPEKPSFASFILNSLKSGKEITTATDQYCNQIFADQLSECILNVCEKEQRGIFNIACTDTASRHEFALFVCDVFDLDKNLVKKAKLKDLSIKFGWKAQRPKDTTLNISKVGKTFKLPTIKSSLEEYKKTLMKRN